jgi:GxxExxY protein
MTELLFKELTRRIIGIYYDVYNGTGRTYPEYVYERAMLWEANQQAISCVRQEEYQIFYKDCLVGAQRLDLFFAEDVIVELKVRPSLGSIHRAQTYSYLRTFGKQVGLLFNFGGSQAEFERLFFTTRPPELVSEVLPTTASSLPSDLIAPELVYEILGGLYTVHSTLGPGFVHRIYGNACYEEMQLRGLPVQRQRHMQVIYKGEAIASIEFGHLRLGNWLVVFPVATGDINNIHLNNLRDWLRAEGVKLGIVANFQDVKLKPIFLKP